MGRCRRPLTQRGAVTSRHEVCGRREEGRGRKEEEEGEEERRERKEEEEAEKEGGGGRRRKTRELDKGLITRGEGEEKVAGLGNKRS